MYASFEDLLFAFQGSDLLPADVKAPENPIPFTEVNSLPLEFTHYVAPYLPCKPEVVKATIDLATITSEDVLTDLGSGDGRVLKEALSADSLPKRCIGVELDPFLFDYSTKTLGELPHGDKATVVNQDLFAFDLIDAGTTVAIAYLLPPALDRLKPNLIRWLSDKSGTGTNNFRILVINYRIPGWVPDDIVNVMYSGCIEPMPINIYRHPGPL